MDRDTKGRHRGEIDPAGAGVTKDAVRVRKRRTGSSRRRAGPAARSQALMVLGMHRSGTSALAGALGLGGVALPAHLMPATDANPRGYFESQRFYELHEELLSDLGTPWYDLSPLPSGFLDSPEAEAWVERLAEAVRAEFGDSPLFVLKDPRLCRLVPLWKRVLDKVGADARWILVVRNPLEVAASLQREHAIEGRLGELLWLDHVLQAERATRGHRRVVVNYGQLIEDWRGTFRRLEDRLGLSFPSLSRRAEAAIDAFLQPSLRHHRVSIDDLARREDVIDWVKAVASWAESADVGEQDAAVILDPIRVAMTEAESVFGPVMASLTHARREWQAEADSLREALGESRSSGKRSEEELARTEAELETSRGRVAELRDALADRDRQVEGLLTWVNALVGWAVQTAAETPVPRDSIDRALAILDAASPEEAPYAATAALRFAGLSAEVDRRGRILEQQRGLIEEIQAVRDEQKQMIARLIEARAEQAARLEEREREQREVAGRLALAEASLRSAVSRTRVLDREAAELRARLAATAARAERESIASSESLAHIGQRLEETERALADSMRAVEEKRAETMHLSDVVAEREAEAADWRFHVEQLTERLAAVDRSLTWRLSRPLRALVDFVGR